MEKTYSFEKDQVILSLRKKYENEQLKTLHLLDDIESRNKFNRELQLENTELKRFNAEMMRKVDKLEKLLKFTENKQGKRLKSQMHQDFERELMEKNPELLSKNVMDILAKRVQKPKQWNRNDVAKAFAARSISRKTVRLVRDVYKLPSPSLSSLRDYASKIKIVRGKFHHNLQTIILIFNNFSRNFKVFKMNLLI